MYRKSTDYVKLMTVSHPFSFKIGRILVASHHLPPVWGWVVQGVFPVIIGYPTLYLESFICLFLLFRVYVRGAVVGLHQSYHPHSFVKCCYMFYNMYLMFKGVDIIFLSAHLMFSVVVFMLHT